ncbi:MAG: class B sortase [Lachnospiraceae bacterium]|nr:class B sortase [Lachnospiraceae bacterium]
MKSKNIIFSILAIALIGVLLYSGYKALEIYIPQHFASRNFENLKKEYGIKDEKASDIIKKYEEGNENIAEGGITKLSKKNSDFVGWMTIEDTVIDYPVMKSKEEDPEYYLHRDFNKNYSYSGSLFIGAKCDENSEVFIVYGHNMSADTMFGTLDNYRDSIFADKHRDIVFQTSAGKRVYRVFAAFKTKIGKEKGDEFEYYRSVGQLGREKYDEALEKYRNMSLISLNDSPQYPQQIMLLSTCAYHTEEGRFVVAAYRIA